MSMYIMCILYILCLCICVYIDEQHMYIYIYINMYIYIVWIFLFPENFMLKHNIQYDSIKWWWLCHKSMNRISFLIKEAPFYLSPLLMVIMVEGSFFYKEANSIHGKWGWTNSGYNTYIHGNVIMKLYIVILNKQKYLFSKTEKREVKQVLSGG
jgi:hypothetical protein